MTPPTLSDLYAGQEVIKTKLDEYLKRLDEATDEQKILLAAVNKAKGAMWFANVTMGIVISTIMGAGALVMKQYDEKIGKMETKIEKLERMVYSGAQSKGE